MAMYQENTFFAPDAKQNSHARFIQESSDIFVPFSSGIWENRKNSGGERNTVFIKRIN
jgi:hypothetical protein